MENVKTIIRAGQAIQFDRTTLLPIERVVINASRGNTGLLFTAWKEPFAIVVRDTHGLRAYDCAAKQVPIDVLKKDVANLDEQLGIA